MRKAFAGVYIIDLAGELTSSVQDGLLNASEQASSEGARVLILNFSHLVYKNSSGIKSVVALLARRTGQNGHDSRTPGQREVEFVTAR